MLNFEIVLLIPYRRRKSTGLYIEVGK